MSRFRGEIIATAAVLVLVVIGVVALWPNGGGPDGGAPNGTDPAAAGILSDPAPDAAALAGLRQRAQLAACPAGAGPPAGPLAAVVVPCLGAQGDVDLGRALAGRTVLLNLWASWCQPCRTELPVLAEYAARPGAVPVLLVNLRDAPGNALTLLADLGVRLPAVTDPTADLRAALRAPPTLPTSYVLRPDGSLTRVDPPIAFRSADEVAAAIARYIGPGR